MNQARPGLAAAPRSALRLVAGEDLVAPCRCYTLEAEHHFGRRCGIYTHHVMRSETQTVGLNMACIEGFDVFALGEVEVGNGQGWSLVRRE